MKNPGFADRLNLALDHAGFPPKNRGRIQRLADMMELSHRGASKWINGQSAPPVKKHPVLAEKLQVNLNWLSRGEGEMVDAIRINTLRNIPVFLVYEEGSPLYYQPCHLPPEGQFFGIQLETEAMSPRFPQSSIMIFEKTSCVKDGDYVWVQHPDYPEPLFRQLLIKHQIHYFMANFKDAQRIAIDGLRVEFEQGWGLLRASNTTPCLVARFEAQDQAALIEIQSLFKDQLLALDAALPLPW